MNKETADKFLRDNKEALQLLSNEIRKYDTIDDITNFEELVGRQRAKKIISAWIGKVWNISLDDLPEAEDEDSIFQTK